MILKDANGVALERTGWRDQAISQRHRKWGVSCPAVDLDFLLVEYNLGAPIALVEYKHERAYLPDPRHATYRALRNLCDHYSPDPLPFLVAFYWPDCWAFRVHPMNDTAREGYAEEECMTEREYVARLYGLRKLAITRQVLSTLNDRLAPVMAPARRWSTHRLAFSPK